MTLPSVVQVLTAALDVGLGWVERVVGAADTIAAVARVAMVNFIVLGGGRLEWLLMR